MSTLPPVITDYPVMSVGNIDYLTGNSYEVKPVEPQEAGNRRIQHRLNGQNLIRQLIDDDQAVFSCAIVSTLSCYRGTEIVRDEFVRVTENLIVAEQELKGETPEYSSPTMFQPQIITTEEITNLNLTANHGVQDILLGHTVSIPKAARIAYAPYFRIEVLGQSILRVKEDKHLPNGCFEVHEVKENGFYFLVKMSPDLYAWMKNPGKSIQHRQSIYCFALAQGLEILRQKYYEPESWREFANLQYLYQHLKKINAPLWIDEDFSPNRAVALWIPHVFDSTLDTEFD